MNDLMKMVGRVLGNLDPNSFELNSNEWVKEVDVW